MRARKRVFSTHAWWYRLSGWVALLAIAVVIFDPVLTLAQGADADRDKIVAGEVLKLTVPGRPDLSGDMTVEPDGTVDVPQVGEVSVVGLDVATAETVLRQKIRLFIPTLDSLDLERMSRAGGPRIYVIGQVVQPGALSFASPPSLWDVVRGAGGPLADANLRDARVIREEDGKPDVHPVDLAGLLDGTDVPIFTLRDGDTLIIPRLAEGVSGVASSDGVKVFGSVAVPSVVPTRDPIPLLDVIMLAGAPTETAKLSKVFWVHEEGGRSSSTEVDLARYLMLGDPSGNPLVYPGDTVNVTYEKPSWVRANVPFILGSLAAVATILLAYDNITRDR